MGYSKQVNMFSVDLQSEVQKAIKNHAWAKYFSNDVLNNAYSGVYYHSNEIRFTALWFDRLAESMLVASVSIASRIAWNDQSFYYQSKYGKLEAKVEDELMPMKKIVSRPVIINMDEYLEYLRTEKPYIYDWLSSNSENSQMQMASRYAALPAAEILNKCGYVFANAWLRGEYSRDDTDLDRLNRLVDLNGTNPKNIFKCSTVVAKSLKNVTELSIWDNSRKLVKQHPDMTVEDLNLIRAIGLDNKALVQVRSILNKTYRGRAVFTLSSLLNYLDRVDQFEAICQQEALQLLNDYLNMCNQLEIRPKVDGDSLKREHDIAARMIILQKNSENDENIKKVYEEYSTYSYEDSNLIIRPVKDYADLLNEAQQQHNCVASYASRIAQHDSIVFVLRYRSNPNVSLVTIETDAELTTIRQKLMAYNQPIRNKEITEFLENWLKRSRQQYKDSALLSA